MTPLGLLHISIVVFKTLQAINSEAYSSQIKMRCCRPLADRDISTVSSAYIKWWTDTLFKVHPTEYYSIFH